MKRVYLYILLFVLGFKVLPAQELTALDSVVTVSFQNESLLNCLERIKKDYHISFTYSSNDLNTITKKFTAVYTRRPLSYVLDELLKDSKLGYRYLGGQIAIYKKKKQQPLAATSKTQSLAKY